MTAATTIWHVTDLNSYMQQIVMLSKRMLIFLWNYTDNIGLRDPCHVVAKSNETVLIYIKLEFIYLNAIVYLAQRISFIF